MALPLSGYTGRKKWQLDSKTTLFCLLAGITRQINEQNCEETNINCLRNDYKVVLIKLTMILLIFQHKSHKTAIDFKIT